MIKSLYDKFKHWSAKGSVYIISDPHFEDLDCKLMDPNWISPEEHIQKLKAKVHKNDTLICLGDCGNAEWFNQLKCYKVLIKGNHDSGSTNYLKKREYSVIHSTAEDSAWDLIKQLIKKGELDGYEDDMFHIVGYKIHGYFDEVYEGPLFISEKILLSHEPIEGLDFCLNIHGHRHQDKHNPDKFHLNVASDVINYDVISLGDLIKSGAISDIQTIHRETINHATKRKLEKL